MQEVNVMASVALQRCPRCRKGKMFCTPAYNYLEFHKMHEKCAHCDLKFEVEPGFFWGAMFVSYAMVVALFVTEFVALSVLGLLRSGMIYYMVPVTVIVLLPFIFRYSRVLFLYWFGGIKYQKP
ncbi:MAG: DUF983 domain-containing protein [Cyclobacteriaceae bacterium]|nr:DUF983 domain-containing protein [Cyclobacteriaceae bacterium]